MRGGGCFRVKEVFSLFFALLFFTSGTSRGAEMVKTEVKKEEDERAIVKYMY